MVLRPGAKAVRTMSHVRPFRNQIPQVKQLIIRQNQAISPLTSNAIPPAQLVGTSHIPFVRPVFGAEIRVRSPSQGNPISYRQN